MTTLFDILFGRGSRPIRREAQVRITVDSEGNPAIEPTVGESVALSPEGSIDRATFSTFHHCGCTAQVPMGGQCAEPLCHQVSCQRCFGRCSVCLKPTCLEHTRYLEMPQAQQIRLCCACHGMLKRKRLVGNIIKGIFNPFAFREKPKGR